MYIEILQWIIQTFLLFQHKELEQYLIQPKGDYNPDMPIDEQTSCIAYDAKWEFPKERLRLGKTEVDYWVPFY